MIWLTKYTLPGQQSKVDTNILPIYQRNFLKFFETLEV